MNRRTLSKNKKKSKKNVLGEKYIYIKKMEMEKRKKKRGRKKKDRKDPYRLAGS